MKFETIKANAKKIFYSQVEQWDRIEAWYGNDAAFKAMLPFSMQGIEARRELADFAKSFQADAADTVASAAKSEGKLAAWNQMILKARESGLAIIDNWDVRQVLQLLDLFPKAAPAAYRKGQLRCYMADNRNMAWMVERVRHGGA